MIGGETVLVVVVVLVVEVEELAGESWMVVTVGAEAVIAGVGADSSLVVVVEEEEAEVVVTVVTVVLPGVEEVNEVVEVVGGARPAISVARSWRVTVAGVTVWR